MKAFTFLYNSDPLYQKAIDINLGKGVELNVLKDRKPEYDGWSPRVLSDIDRMTRLKDDPSLNWMDADCIFLKEIDFELEKDYPYFYSQGGQLDSCVILGNNCKDLFEFICSKFDKERPIEWYFKLINGELRNRIRPIPEGYFLHLSLNSCKRQAERTGHKIIGYGYSVQFIDGAWDLKIF